jgi:hypothetical protein
MWDPVCGCNGVTYTNSINAARAGVNVASEGICAPDISVDPNSYYFYTIFGDEPDTVEITISNIGSQDLYISSILLLQDERNGYSLDVDGGSNPCGSITPIIIPMGEYRTLTVQFTPTTFICVNHIASLLISSNDPDSPDVTVGFLGRSCN